MAALLVFLGGGLGALLRYGAGRLAAFPFGTLIVNVSGCLAMGLLLGWLTSRGADHGPARLFLATGLLGGFTTFSAFSFDTLLLWQRGAHGAAFAYVAASVILSLAAVALGFALTRSF